VKTYTEDTFEKLIVEHLVLQGGYEPRGFDPASASYAPDEALAANAGYDVHRALIPAEVTGFVQATFYVAIPVAGIQAFPVPVL
jgi:hypothetical protein